MQCNKLTKILKNKLYFTSCLYCTSKISTVFYNYINNIFQLFSEMNLINLISKKHDI